MRNIFRYVLYKERKRRSDMLRRRQHTDRADYELGSINNKKPWLEMGISRAWWYRTVRWTEEGERQVIDRRPPGWPRE